MTGQRVRVAGVQMTSELGQEARNLKRVLAAIDEAAANGAELVVFPEGMNNGYIFDSPEQAYALATPVPGPFTDGVAAKTRERGVYAAMGILERREGGRVFNDALLFGPDGRIAGKAQKTFFIKADKHWLSPGELEYPIFETPLGRVGFFICADGRIPEPARCLALNGADLYLNCSNWGSPDQYLAHVPTRAVENHCWVIGVTKVGEEPGNRYTGCSFIMDPAGRVYARASADKEEIIYAVIEPTRARDKRVGPSNDLFRDRRPETYGLLTVPTETLPVTRQLQEPLVPAQSSAQVAVIQLVPLADPERVLEAALHHCREAVHKYFAEILVLPELFPFLPDRVAADPRAAARVSEKALGEFLAFTRQTADYVALSLVEQDNGRFHSTAYLVGPEGVLGKYRKVHLWDQEQGWATPGDAYPVFATRFGRLGLLMGYDGLFPECARSLTLNGADLLLWPCAWQAAYEYQYVAHERTLENKVTLCAANRLDSPCPGPSLIIQPLGYPVTTLAVEAPPGQIGFRSRFVTLALSRDKRILQNTDLVAHRTPALYGALTRPARVP
ncbi:MAG: carbon-nitrogen hydrolase family protein [Deltaproteobacteria bacterium]|nr:carbon-nitrogen hydrolase family protein [Deltaproteobacteria bacterium]